MPSANGLYYFAHGVQDLTRPPVILVHGAGGHHLYWPPQVRRLPGERIYAVDLPGHGKSDGIGHHTLRDYALDLMGFIETLKLNRAVLIGHSLGGGIALQLAIEFPDHVLALGLLGSAARLSVDPQLLHLASDPAKAEMAAHLITENSFAAETSQRLRELAEQRLLQARPTVLYGDLLACDAFDATDRAGQITVPALILFGAEDRMVSLGRARALARQMPGARLEIVPGAAHMVMLEQPERTAGLLAAFLKELNYLPGM